MNDFINYALTIVLLMLLYYVGKFFFVGPKGKEPSLEERRAALKKGIEWVKGLSPKEKKELKEEEQQVRKEEKELERRQEEVEHGEKKSEKMKSNLLRAVTCINKAIQNLNDKEAAKRWIHKAKRHMIKARDVDVLERITTGTPLHNKALEIRHYLVQMREALDTIPFQEAPLKRFNQNLGAVISHIGGLIAQLYEEVETKQQAAQQRRGKATGARPVARAKRLRTR